MKYPLTLFCGLLLVPAVLAQPAVQRSPESLLAADTAFYFRYDGLTAGHKKAYEQSALARVLTDDAGGFLDYLAVLIKDQMLRQAGEPGADGHVPKERREAEKMAAAWGPFLDCLWENGIVVGVELVDQRQAGNTGAEGPDGLGGQVTIIFPEGGKKKNRDRLFAMLLWAVAVEKEQQKEAKPQKLRGRTIYREERESSRIFLWQEGNHLVLTLGEDAGRRQCQRPPCRFRPHLRPARPVV